MRHLIASLLLLTLAGCGGGQIIDDATPTPPSSIGVNELPSGAPLPSENSTVILITPSNAAAAVAIAPGNRFVLGGWLGAERLFDQEVRLLQIGLDGTSSLIAGLLPLLDADGRPAYLLPGDLDPAGIYLLAFDALPGESFTDGSAAASVLLQLP